MSGQTKDSEDEPVLDLHRGSWLDQLGWLAQRVADRLIPGHAGAGEPAVVRVVVPERPKSGRQHRK